MTMPQPPISSVSDKLQAYSQLISMGWGRSEQARGLIKIFEDLSKQLKEAEELE